MSISEYQTRTARNTTETARFGHRPVTDEPSISLIAADLYCVLGAAHTMGFVERVGNVYVALQGSDLGRAVEVGQSLSWDVAIAMVERAYQSRH